jgi:hypothetical protein
MKRKGFKMSGTHLIVLSVTTLIVISGCLAIGLLKKIQKRSQAHDSKISDAFEQGGPFSL